MESLKALKQKAADLAKEADAIFAAAAAEKRNLTDEENKRDDEISAEFEKLSADIQRAERHQARLRTMDFTGRDSAPADANAIAAARAAVRGGVHTPGERFASLGEQMLAVAAADRKALGQQDPRLVWFDGTGVSAATGLSESVGSDGGFMVETQMADVMLRPVFEGGEIASRVTRIPIGPNANGISANGVDETSRATGSRWGGVRAYWTGEADAITASQPKFRRIKMELDKITAACYVTGELLKDSTALEAMIRMAFSDEIAFKLEDAIVQGTGAGAPLGYLNAGSLVTVSKETSQVAATIVAENILKMWIRMPARLHRSAVWLCNQDIEPQLHQLNVKIKNVAGSENVGGIATPTVIYNPPGTNGSTVGTLMGRPVIPVEYASTLGTVGDIQLVDLSQYMLIDKGGVEGQSSIHVRFLYDETCFRFIYRANGMPIWNSAVTPYKGTNTQSPFVALETRS
jgi:HK97 family phage major capsid protein